MQAENELQQIELMRGQANQLIGDIQNAQADARMAAQTAMRNSQDASHYTEQTAGILANISRMV